MLLNPYQANIPILLFENTQTSPSAQNGDFAKRPTGKAGAATELLIAVWGWMFTTKLGPVV